MSAIPDPRFARAESLHNQAIVALRAKNVTAAIDLITQAIAIDPACSRYHVNRGEAYRQSHEPERAIDDLRRAIELDPSNAIAYFNLGLIHSFAERLDDAIECYRHAIELNPDYTKAHFNLATTLRACNLYDQAEAEYRYTVALDPKHAEAWNNLGKLLGERMRIDEAAEAFERAIAAQPDHARAHFNLGMMNLLRGDYARGWEEYEWRFRTPAQEHLAPRCAQPKWDGSDLTGKTILLYGEQGAGDCIQFIRYAPLIVGRGAKRVIVTCPAAVVSLLQTVKGVDEVIASGSRLPEFDTYLPLMSAPAILRTTLETVPHDVPYLFPPQGKTDEWRAKLAPHRSKLNVGLTWAGNPKQRNDPNRSAPLEQLWPLNDLKDTTLFSVQKGPASEQLVNNPIKLVDLTSDIHDFLDTAAMLMNLDVVISVDTSVVHLAGALARPTYAMLSYHVEWRWLLDREDSPWYPTMKLFRQRKQSDWLDVAERVRAELTTYEPAR